MMITRYSYREGDDDIYRLGDNFFLSVYTNSIEYIAMYSTGVRFEAIQGEVEVTDLDIIEMYEVIDILRAEL